MVRRYAPKGDGGARLWVTGTLGAPDAWRPSRENWARLEKAFGATFDEPLRADILRAVWRYIDWSSSPAAGDYLQKLERARKLSRELRAAFVSLGDAGSLLAPHWETYSPRDDDDNAPEDDADLVEWALSLPSRKGRDHREIAEVISTLCSAFDDAHREATRRESGQHSNKDTLRQLVSDLAKAFARRGLKVSAAKDRRPSPFVRFLLLLKEDLTGDAQNAGEAALSQIVSQIIKPKNRKTGKNCPATGAKISPKSRKV